MIKMTSHHFDEIYVIRNIVFLRRDDKRKSAATNVNRLILLNANTGCRKLGSNRRILILDELDQACNAIIKQYAKKNYINLHKRLMNGTGIDPIRIALTICENNSPRQARIECEHGQNRGHWEQQIQHRTTREVTTMETSR